MGKGIMMMDRLFRAFILIPTCLALMGQVWAGGKPNILLIIDDQHDGAVMTQRGYPHIETPAIDRLANAGVTFTRAYTPYPICKAMRYSLMTGMMVSQVCPECPGKFQNVTSRTSLGARMKEAGFETAYFGKWHVGQTGLEQVADWHGFETYVDHSSSKGGDTYTTDRILAYLRKPHDRPFFMVASFMNPHDTAEIARQISGFTADIAFKDKPVDWRSINVLKDAPPLPANFAPMEDEPEGFYIRRPKGPGDKYWSSHPTADWTESQWRQYMWAYDRLIEMMDAHLGLVLDELENQELLDDTVIIFTSDHGDGHASHRWNQKMSFYEEAVNVPFIVSWKGKTRAGVIDDTTLISNTLDINTTLLKLAGVTPPAHFRGLDLMPLVLREPGTGTFTPRAFVVTEMTQVNLTGRMVAGSDYKYILFDGGENPEVLIDLANDPGELKPVTRDPGYREELNMARQTLRDWVTETSDTFNIGAIPTTSPAAIPVVESQVRPDSAMTPGESSERTWGERMEIAAEGRSASGCGADTQGIVRMSISGNPGDAFRIYLRCGDDTAAKCTARISGGANTASCQDGPNEFITGEYRCTAKPLIRNSPEAKITSAACE
jgi:arylsulfatase A-like enzyme